jgi:hypothetical protein
MRGRLRPSPAMVVACIALFVALGGSSYAVTRLPANSVGPKQLKKNAVTGAKVKNRSLTAADIKVSSLAGVASAATAANAANATHAAAAAGLDKVTYVKTPGGVAPAPPPDPQGNGPSTIGGGTATCPAGMFAVGGGVGVDDNVNTSVVDSFPDPSGHAWTVRVDNSDPGSAHGFTVVAVCVAAAAAG